MFQILILNDLAGGVYTYKQKNKQTYRTAHFRDTGTRFLSYGTVKVVISIWIDSEMGARFREVPVSRRFDCSIVSPKKWISTIFMDTLPWRKCSYHINCTSCKCAIYGQIIKSGAMMGIEIFKYREHTVLALALEKIWEF